ncbi:MAG: OPT/YSL family transporter [Opitutales bacterium]
MAALSKFLKRPRKQDSEIEQFRSLMEVPSTFEDGFNFKTFLGALFIGLIMIPGALYMELLAGNINVGPAAQWVTIILFIEAARRAQQNLKKAEIFILFFMAGIAVHIPFHETLLWNQFYRTSEAAYAMGIANDVPTWYAPTPEGSSYDTRSFFQSKWLVVILLVGMKILIGQISQVILGYGLFKLTSDIERLPFPLATVGAQGVLSLAEDTSERKDNDTSWRWRVFSIGGALGMGFGFIYLGITTLSTIFATQPIMILPQPWVDLTTDTASILPAVATGFSFDLSHIIIGMVLPFWAMVGSFIGVVVTFIANPILYRFQILQEWKPGDGTVDTLFLNNVDVYLSFNIGISAAVALVGIAQCVAIFRKNPLKNIQQDVPEGRLDQRAQTPIGRGDIKAWIILSVYLAVTVFWILVCGYLIDWHTQVMAVLIFLGFFYTPLLGYVTARLEGLAGQVVEIPMIKEAMFILSGYSGVAVWFLPMPAISMVGLGQITVRYRECELTGTSFKSLWKATLLLYPIILVCQVFFASFIWSLAEVPSARYPFAEEYWDLDAKNRSIVFSATLGDYSTFEQAFSWTTVGVGASMGLGLFAVMRLVQAPIFLTYGVVKGLNQSMPHIILPNFIGALIGRYYFQRKLGLKWRQYIPVVAAGFFCGYGLITMVSIGLTFLSRAAIQFAF